MRRSHRLALAVLVAAVGAALAWSFLPRPVEVETAAVTRGPFDQQIDEDGKTRVRERYVVSAPLSGQLQRIVLKAGDRVRRGQGVATIAPNAPALLDARTLRELDERIGAAQAAKARAAAEVARIEATLAKAEADLARSAQLAAGGFVAPTQKEQIELDNRVTARALDAARQAAHVADHELATARAAMLRSQQASPPAQHWTVRAPADGVVLKVMQESAAVVPLGTPLLEVGNPDQIEVVADVLSSDAAQIRPGAAVQIAGWGMAAPLPATVRRVEPSAYTKISALGVEEQRVNVLIDISAPPAQWQGLGDGHQVEVSINVFHADQAVRVPVSALYRQGGQWAVLVAEQGRARQRIVRVARRNGQQAMVDGGVQPGEQVIVYPGDQVGDGKAIRPRAGA